MAHFEFADMVMEYKLPLKVFEQAKGEYNNAGKWIKGAETPRDIEGVVLPLSNDELKYDPNGTYTTMDRKIYVVEPLKIGTKIEYEGIKYTIHSAKPNNAYTDVFVYFAKGVDNQ